MKIKQELRKWKNFLIASLILGFFFLLNFFHSWANNFFIKLHFCNHLYCTLFSLIFFGFAYFAWKKKRSYLKIALIVLIVGIILMNITVCSNGVISLKGDSLKELFTTYPLTTNVSKICADSCVGTGWEFGEATKVANLCLESGDRIEGLEVTESSYFYDEVNKVHCCCYNTIEAMTCEDLGYYANPPSLPHNGWEQINIGGLICWKSPPEKVYICCEMFNLDKTGEKVDIAYELMTNDGCNEMLDLYEGVNIVGDSLCEK